MSAERDLRTLLKSMSPVLLEGEFVFLTFANARYGDFAELEPMASFMESEGLSLVVPKARADEQGMTYEGLFKCISLQVHSSLEAVGLTAAISKKLTDYDISANVIAGYFHDHVFVQREFSEQAILALQEFAG